MNSSSIAPYVEETGWYANYGSSTFLNFIVPLFILIGVSGAFYMRLRVLALGRAGLPEWAWNILNYLPSFCLCSPAETGIGGNQYNAVSQSDDLVSMSNLGAYEVETTPVTTVSVPKEKKGMQLSKPATAATEDAGDAAIVTVPPPAAAAAEDVPTDAAAATTASAMTSPFTMKFDEDEEEDDTAWKAF